MSGISIPEPKNPKLLDIHKFCFEVYKFLQEPISEADPGSIMDRISVIPSWMGRSLTLAVLSKRILTERMAEETVQVMKDFPTTGAMDRKAIVAGRVSEEAQYHEWVDGMSKRLVHIMDGLRTNISFLKEEMRMSGMSQS